MFKRNIPRNSERVPLYSVQPAGAVLQRRILAGCLMLSRRNPVCTSRALLRVLHETTRVISRDHVANEVSVRLLAKNKSLLSLSLVLCFVLNRIVKIRIINYVKRTGMLLKAVKLLFIVLFSTYFNIYNLVLPLLKRF